MSEYSLTTLFRVTRATPLAPDERRAALVAATRPLLLEHGLNITTKQVAEAAGVAEGTIFRAFETKDRLFCAVLQDALDPAPVVARILALPELDLTDTVARLLELLQADIGEIRALFMAMGSAHPKQHQPVHDAHTERDAAIRAALIAVLERFGDQLRVSPEIAAWTIKSFAFTIAHPFIDPAITEPRALASLILHGICEKPC